uniref:non-specific serine/threonine protein kinase n=1 Tax=Chaetosphaeridium globosum TaxID=96477 RepID=A0A126WW81_CHAGL|nr:putative LOV domain-containing protein [Chaetosphaeridium globosum]
MGSPSGSGRNLAGQGPAAHIPEDGEVERQPAPDAKTPDLRDSTDSSGMELGECRIKEMRRGIDIATTLERIQKNFVITDPRLPDNPIIFASDSFLELTEYTREEIIGRNCRFLQGEGTDRATVQRIRDAIRTEKDVTVQLLNYTKSGKPFWNLFHLQAVKDQQGLLQYFIGVQLDGSLYLDKNKKLSEDTASKGTVLIRETASKVDTAVKELPDAALKKEDLWAGHQVLVLPKPHKCNSSSWEAVRRVAGVDTRLRLKHFRPVKPLGAGDTGNVHLVELRDTGKLFAMKAMDKNSMIARNKVHRTNMEREILGSLDHPFLPTLYSSFTTKTHVCLITDYCSGGELFTLMDRQPEKRFSEASARFYCAEVLLALEYLHLKGVIYRDLKPENVLLMDTGHIQLTDFDLSFLTRSSSTVFKKTVPAPRSSPVVMSRKARMRRKRSLRKSKARGEEGELSSSMSVMVSELVVEPAGTSNSFVGTEEYIAPEVITGSGHTGTIDWWAFGVLLYELLCGKTPFRGRNRQRTFRNILEKPVIMPPNIEISSEGQDLIQKLLIRDPLRRLGSQRGANEIKEHPFFRAINFPLIRTMVPPPLKVPAKFVYPDVSSLSPDVDWDALEARTPSPVATDYF